MSQKQKSKQQQSTSYLPKQGAVLESLDKTYSPYVGQGILGGLSDLEENALNMLRSADIWGPIQSAGKGLLEGTMGAAKVLPEMAGQAFDTVVAKPAIKLWDESLRPAIKEAFAGPGYWGKSRAEAEAKGATDLGESLAAQRGAWQWDTESANRAIDESKAGRALSALGAVPSSLLGWAGGLSGLGRQTQTILNTITDPQVMAVMQTILGTTPMGTQTSRATAAPSMFEQAGNWASVFNKGMGALGGLAV